MYFNCQRQSGSGGPRFTGAYTSRRRAAGWSRSSSAGVRLHTWNV
jgi:hypothetical protein